MGNLLSTCFGEQILEQPAASISPKSSPICTPTRKSSPDIIPGALVLTPYGAATVIAEERADGIVAAKLQFGAIGYFSGERLTLFVGEITSTLPQPPVQPIVEIQSPATTVDLTPPPSEEVPRTASNISSRGSIKRAQSRGSILMERVPDIVNGKLQPAHFVLRPEIELTEDERKSVVTASIADEDILIGYQVTLLSKSTGKPKGVYVILGIKKFRLSTSQYLLRNEAEEDKWTVLQKDNAVTGKQFILRRKVAPSLDSVASMPVTP